MSLGATLMDYVNNPASGGVDGFSSSTQSEVTDLLKALEARDITGRETTNLTNASGAPLKVESLEKQLKVITYKEDQIRLWKTIPKKAAYNTVEEYNELREYGGDFGGGFNLEGELPDEETSTYVRKAQLVKFLGTTRSVSHPMQLVNTHIGNIIDRENQNGTLWILRKLDRALTDGDETIVPQEFNGFYSQQQRADTFGGSLLNYYNSGSVVDLRGAPMSEEAYELAANSIIENFGFPDTFYGAPRVLSDFVKNFYGNKFIVPNSASLTDGIMGQRVQKFASQFGDVSLNHDIFMNQRPSKTTASQATSTKAAPAPTVVSATPVAVDANAKWATVDAANYIYAVSALNRHGESALAVINPVPAAVVAGGAIDLQFTATASPFGTTGFMIYRSQKNATSAANATFYPLFKVSTAELTAGFDGGAAGVARDRNHILPNTNQAFVIQNSTEVWEFAQLAPLMKMDLAVLGPAFRWMILMYGTPFLYAPRKMVRFINVGLNT